MSGISDIIENSMRKMSFNLNLPLGPWFVIVVIIVALFMALICTAIMYICCRGCYAHGPPPANQRNPNNLAVPNVMQDKPPSYRRFLRNLSNINLRVLGGSNNANTSRAADTGTPPPKYGDVVSKFQFSSKEIKEFESMQNGFANQNKFRPSIAQALRQPPERSRHLVIPEVCVTPPPVENIPATEVIQITEDPPPEYTPPSSDNLANSSSVGCYDNPTCVITDQT